MSAVVGARGHAWLGGGLPEGYGREHNPRLGHPLVAGQICDLATTGLELGHEMLNLIGSSGCEYPAWGEQLHVVWLLPLGAAQSLPGELVAVGWWPASGLVIVEAGECCRVPASCPRSDAGPCDPVWLVAPTGQPGSLIGAQVFARTFASAAEAVAAAREGLPESRATP